jgi:Fe-S-cluster containining protein
MTTAPETRVKNLDRDQPFQFRCGTDLACFTDCCRQLDLALTPYDVLRLGRNLRISGAEFLERYAVIEHEAGDAFPQVYLGMVDDGLASCPFVSVRGCTVYPDRPGACRTYPLGRGARLDPDGKPDDFYVVLSEPHCRGFAENNPQTVLTWLADQELAPYNQFNDMTMRILHHSQIRQGFRPTAAQQKRYLELLYSLTGFATPLEASDEQRLRQGLTRLADELFPA